MRDGTRKSRAPSGTRCRQDRRGELEEAGLAHAPPDRGDDRKPLHDVGVQRLAPQVQEAIGEAQILRVLRLAEHGHRQLLGRRQHLDLGDDDFDLARRKLGVHGGLPVDNRPVADRTIDADHPLGAHRLGNLEGGAVGVGNHLGQAVVVAQVDEQQAAVVAHAMHPARQARVGAHVGAAQRPAGVRSVAVQGSRRRRAR